MSAFAWILLVLICFHIVWMAINPVMETRANKHKVHFRGTLLFSLLAPFSGYFVLSWLFTKTNGPEMMSTSAHNALAIAAWVTLAVGSTVVARGLLMKPRPSTQA